MNIPLPVLNLSDCDPARPLRAFIGLWPDQAARRYLQEQARRAHGMYGGRMMQPEHFHLTLAFLGNSPVPALQALAAQLPDWTAPQVAFELSVQGVFQKPRVVWAGPDDSQQQALAVLQSWHEDIWARLQALGWERTERRFRPHISLLRHVRLDGVDTREQPLPRQSFAPAGAGLIVSVPENDRSRYHLAACLGRGMMRA